MSDYYQKLGKKAIEREKGQIDFENYPIKEVVLPYDYFEEIKRELGRRYVDLSTCITFKTLIVREIESLKSELAFINSRINIVESPRTVEPRDMAFEEAKPLVEDFLKNYLKEHEDVYPSDVADGLGLKYELVKEIFDILENEEKLKKKVE